MVRGSSHIGDAIILRIYTNAFPTHAHAYVPHHKSINEIYTHILCYVLGGNLLDKASPRRGAEKLSPMET